MRFHERLVYSFVPNFVDIQRKSFYLFLKQGLVKELAKINPIRRHYVNIELHFIPELYKLTRPDCTPTEALFQRKSYSCKLYVPVKIKSRQKKTIKKHTNKKNTKWYWVLLGHIPLMTKTGHFIMNGSPRVVINQLLRCPGLYCQEVIVTLLKEGMYQKFSKYYADFISLRGAWLRFELDVKERSWVRMKKRPKVSAVIFLQTLYNIQYILFYMTFACCLNFVKKNKHVHPSTKQEACFFLYSKLCSNQVIQYKSSNDVVEFIEDKFLKPKTYTLGLLGRHRVNKKLQELVKKENKGRFHNVNEKMLPLTKEDFFYALNYLLSLKFGLGQQKGMLDDIDNLKNRRVKTSGQLIQNQLRTGCVRLKQTIRENMRKHKKKFSLKKLINTKPINSALREFFGSSPLSQYMDQTNPLAEITHKRRVSTLGPGGLSRETAGMEVRSIHPTYYGRICPIETPEGRNAGLVNSLTIHATINTDGFLTTPFYNVFQGQIQKQDSSIQYNKPQYLSAEEEEAFKVAPGDLKGSFLHFLPNNKIPVRFGTTYSKVPREEVEYINMSPIQMISIATSLIPFLEHDDANRALMGSNMQRQAVPIIIPERPIVGTGLEGRTVGDSGCAVQSRKGGCVLYASGKKIVVFEANKNFLHTKNTKDTKDTESTKSTKDSLSILSKDTTNREKLFETMRIVQKFRKNLFKENSYLESFYLSPFYPYLTSKEYLETSKGSLESFSSLETSKGLNFSSKKYLEKKRYLESFESFSYLKENKENKENEVSFFLKTSNKYGESFSSVSSNENFSSDEGIASYPFHSFNSSYLLKRQEGCIPCIPSFDEGFSSLFFEGIASYSLFPFSYPPISSKRYLESFFSYPLSSLFPLSPLSCYFLFQKNKGKKKKQKKQKTWYFFRYFYNI